MLVGVVGCLCFHVITKHSPPLCLGSSFVSREVFLVPLLLELLVLHLEFEFGCSPLLVEVRGDCSHVELNSVAEILLEALLESEELRVLDWELELNVLLAYVHGDRVSTGNLARFEETGLGVRVKSCGLLTIAVGGESTGLAAV